MASSSQTNYQNQKTMDHVLKGIPFTPPNSYWLALFITVPSLAGTGGVEVSTSGTAYARIEIKNDGSGWAGPSGANQEYANISDLVLSVPTANWGTITGAGLYDQQTGGNLAYVSTLTSPKSVSNGDGAPRVLAGQMRMARATC